MQDKIIIIAKKSREENLLLQYVQEDYLINTLIKYSKLENIQVITDDILIYELCKYPTKLVEEIDINLLGNKQFWDLYNPFYYLSDDNDIKNIRLESLEVVKLLIGKIYFDYAVRETKSYKDAIELYETPNLIIGDSRIKELKLPEYETVCFPGISAKQLSECLTKIEFKMTNVIINLGINDALVNRDIYEFKLYVEKITSKLNYKNIYFMEIISPRYRGDFSQNAIKLYNEYLRKNFNFIELNNMLSDVIGLKKEFTYDGLHFSISGIRAMKNAVIRQLKEN